MARTIDLDIAYSPRNVKFSKVGAAYSDVTLVDRLSGASWAYDWSPYAGGDLPRGVEYCPMLWGPKFYSQWYSAASDALSAGSGCFLGFNEPDIAEQANMTPKQAAIDFQTYMTPYSGQATLVTPAVTNGEGDMIGLNWLEQWFTECNGRCKADRIAIHYYANSGSTDFINYVTTAIDLAERNGIPSIWITEFQNTGSSADQILFLHEVIPWLNNNTAIERYAYFFVADEYLLSGTELNAIGQAYMSYS
ncbi:hypothetical protein BGW36DRAFT_304412 [Talaromyces proteolyticus]|uniref:Asl1-like glycosyl hydrolase catalytic domain-containing protein n=1 Tax=Talaromyces proteolyticus TaxID=1131652 RepID=A0AAD4PWN1_9EURO|nr:uncharacterized protein BGW36DRAFT_304412 [Talaromyces proteolyticus]KAH8691799.1 hypothetical protein BGW36DRAFT_304412 [Talaromyces proteolyticus]